ERLRLGPVAELGDELGLGCELVAVASAELLEALGDVVEPLAQLVARRELAPPFVKLRRLTGNTPRPDVVDQHAVAVTRLGRVVDALGAHVSAHCAAMRTKPPTSAPYAACATRV